MLHHTFRVRSTLGHFRSVPFQTATRLLHDSDNSPSTYDRTSIDHKLNNLRSEMEVINKATSMAVDRLSMEIKGLGDILSMEMKSVLAIMDAKFEISDAKTQSKFDILRVELRDREARFWTREIFTLLAVAGLTTTAAVLQFYNRAIQTPVAQTPVVQTPMVQTPIVGHK